MSDLATVPTDAASIAPEPAAAPISIQDHAAQYSPEARAAEADANAADATDGPRQGETPAQAQQRRDKATGQWKEGRVRHRAKSQQAGAEDVPRIQQLTAKHRAAEERATALEAELTKYRQGAPQTANGNQPTPQQPQPQQRPQMPPQGWQGDPEPVSSDEKYATNYEQFLIDRQDWAARRTIREYEAHQRQQAQQQQIATSWRTKAEAAKAKYADFEQVALSQAVPWAQGSVVDQFIVEDDAGPEILYHLQSHPDERDNLGRMTVLQASRYLSLLSQRLLSPSPDAAGTNGAALRTTSVVQPPKPPTPLRTEAQRPTPTAPPTDGSLSIDDHKRHFGQKRRR